MANLPPLSGAILISNPRNPNMPGSALVNPNDKRRLNKLARLVVKEGLSPSAAAELWLSQRGVPKSQRDRRLQRGDAKAAMQHIASGQARKQTKAEKAAYKKAKRAVAKAFMAADPAHYKKSGRGRRKKTYAGRAVRSHASRYLSARKKAQTKRSVFGKERTVNIINVEGVRSFNREAVARRAAGQGGHVFSPKHGRPFPARAGGKKARKAVQGARKASPAFLAAGAERRQLVAAGKAAGIQGASKMKSAELKAALARTNGSALLPLGDLAFTNPSMGAAGYFLGYALPVTIAGGVAGGVHGGLAAMGVTAKLSDAVSMIPGVGPIIAEKAPFTLQGLLVGSGLALAAGMVGGQVGKYLALTGGAALVLGGGIDVFNLAAASAGSDDEDILSSLDQEMSAIEGGEAAPVGDLAFTNGVSALHPFGDLAFTNKKSFGDLAFTNGMGDGFAYETAPLTMSPDGQSDYGQATLADASYSGADFSLREGQALLNGREAWFRAYGPPSRRVARGELQASHLAGREGHRWGWLIKTVGWDRARHIANMTPKHRVVVIHRLRQAAVASYERSVRDWQQRQAQEASAPQPQSAAGTVSTGATGAQGAASPNTNYLGEPALFVGANN